MNCSLIYHWKMMKLSWLDLLTALPAEETREQSVRGFACLD